MHHAKIISCSMFLLMLLLLPVALMAVEPIGEFKEINGSVTVKSQEGNEREVSLNSPVYTGDTVTTGSNGKARINFINGNRLILGFDTNLKIEKLFLDAQKQETESIFELLRGKTRAFVKKLMSKKSQFKLKTATSIIGVLGTTFTVRYDPQSEITEIFSESGTLEVASSTDLWPPFKVEQNFMISVRKDSKPGAPFPFPAGSVPFRSELELKQSERERVSEAAAIQPVTEEAVTHGKWTRMLMDALPYNSSKDFQDWPDDSVAQLLEGVPDDKVGIDGFKNVINNPQLIPYGPEGQMAVTVVEDSATVFYYLVFPVKGPVNIKAKLKGGSQYWTLGDAPTVISRARSVITEVDIGPVKLKSGGIKRLGVSIPKDGKLISINFKALAASPIMPKGGWNMENKLTNYEMAQTIVQALGWQSELPAEEGSTRKIKGKSEKSMGGLGGYEYAYENFQTEEGFYKFGFEKELPDSQFVIDERLKRDDPYLKGGTHELKVMLKSENYPGDVILKRMEDSFEAYRDVLKKAGFVFGKKSFLVGQRLAEYNIKILLRQLEPEEEAIVVPAEEKTKEMIKRRRSISPVLPHEDAKERYAE